MALIEIQDTEAHLKRLIGGSGSGGVITFPNTIGGGNPFGSILPFPSPSPGYSFRNVQLTAQFVASPISIPTKLEEQTESSHIVPITTFAPEPYRVINPISVLIVPSEGEYIASLVEANIHSSGDTLEEAVENVKSLILDIFEILSTTDPSHLGPEPTKQLARLKSFISRINEL